jgi:hypothetical protein
MAARNVKMGMGEVDVKNVDVEFVVRDGTAKAGTLRISKGGVDWVPTRNSANYHSVTWKELENLLIEYGKPTRKGT